METTIRNARIEEWQLSNQLLRRDEIWFAEKDEEAVPTVKRIEIGGL